MKNKIIFLLGGSPLQQDLLLAAKERYYTVVIDGNADCALKESADKFVNLDFSNIDSLYALALEMKPVLILTMANEQGNLSAAIVNEKIGIKYNSADVVYSTISKIKMKERLNSSLISTASYQPIKNEVFDLSIWPESSFPLIVKPNHSSAGRGVKLVNSHSELELAINDAKKLSRDNFALVEEFIDGVQYSVETISCRGVHSILGITRLYFGDLPYFAETQSMFPADISSEKELRIKKFTLDLLNSFNIDYGACHIEIKINLCNEIYVIELASRIGGWRSEFIKLATGIDYADLLLKSYEDKNLVIRKEFSRYCIVKMIFTKYDVENYEKLKPNNSYVVTPIIWLKEAIGNSKTSLMDSSGYYFITTKNLKDALNVL